MAARRLATLLSLAAVLRDAASMATQLSRRHTLQRGALGASGALAALGLAPAPALASVKGDAEKVLEALQPLTGYIDEEKWDAVRTALKTSPVLELLKVDSKNWVRKAAFDSGDPELIELSEDLASALALTDQYCYNNVFIYFQPGSGKPLVKEPKGQLAIAKTKLKAIIAAL